MPSSEICKEAVSGPIIEGAKVIARSHVPFGEIGELVRQLLSASEKSVLFGPVMVTELTFRLALPLFVTRTSTGGDVVPSANEPKLAAPGLKATQPEAFAFTVTFVRTASDRGGADEQLVHIG